MQRLLMAGAIVVGTLAIRADAAAQGGGVKANERWCLKTNEGGRGGSHVMLCRFVSWSQCMESRNSGMDLCMLNPRLPAR